MTVFVRKQKKGRAGGASKVAWPQGFIVPFIFLSIFSISHSIQANPEILVHFGKKFDKAAEKDIGGWNLGGDVLYKMSINEKSHFAFGARYLFNFYYPDSRMQRIPMGGTELEADAKIKRQFHRLALLTNYRLHLTSQFFIGAVLSLDIWKWQKNVAEVEDLPGDNKNLTEVTSNQFLWNKITTQFAAEFGLKVASQFSLKLEAG